MSNQLSWEQVHAWRLGQQHLDQRARQADQLQVVANIGGLHAQLMTSAELSLWVRVDTLGRSTVQDLLWKERKLVKTWAMRGTLHLLAASAFPQHVAARRATPPRRPSSWYSYHGVTPEEENAILAAVPAVLSDRPQTREELADAVVRETGNGKLRALLLSGWGALLKPSAFRGDLCFGPNQGQNVTFVRPDCWLGAWESDDPEAALQETARRFLTTYGPATLDEFARWWGIEESRARKVFKALDEELSEVTVEGWKAWVLRATLAKMQKASAPAVVRLLPHFDPYTIAVARHSDVLLPKAKKGEVYRPQGWISPVVLIGGRIAGVWERSERGRSIALAINLFAPENDTIRQAIEEEANLLGKFLGAEVTVSGLE